MRDGGVDSDGFEFRQQPRRIDHVEVGAGGTDRAKAEAPGRCVLDGVQDVGAEPIVSRGRARFGSPEELPVGIEDATSRRWGAHAIPRAQQDEALAAAAARERGGILARPDERRP